MTNDFHYDDYSFRKKVSKKLKPIGIDVNVETGIVTYNKNEKMELKCSAVYLLRHGRTKGTLEHKFMSDYSDNAHIVDDAIKDLCEIKENIKNYKFDYVVVCNDIPRVYETAYIFKLLNPELKYDFQTKFKGINNGGWENKSQKTLTGIDLNDFNEREIKHNLFAKSSNGESWAQVIINCIDLINYLNKHYENKRVLLIGQGSILRGLKMLIGSDATPWGDYDVKKLYNLKQEKRHLRSNYATISCLYDIKNPNLYKLKKEKIGVVHGRFQILHYGHMEYILSAKQRCDHLIIGICNPEIELTKFNKVCPHRSKISANPLTFYERMECIKGSLIEAGLSRDQFDIVPFPINFPNRIENYAPKDAKYYMTIFEAWGDEKEKVLKELGFDVEVIKRGTFEDKKSNSTEIRGKIYRDEDWKDEVPNYVYQYITNHHLDERIKSLLKADHDKELEKNIND